VIKALGDGRAVIVGHAYGNWIARMTAVDHPALVNVAGNPALQKEQRLEALRFAFFAPGNDPTEWLEGWHPQVRENQRAAAAAVEQSDWWSATPG
jgi:pimeloyl-ACP methyl ester carboxylesterase